MCRQNSSARALESKQVLDPTAPCWFVKQQFWGEGWIYLVPVRNERVPHFPWFSSAAWNHQRNTNNSKFWWRGLETSHFLGNTSPPEDSELFPAHLYHLYAFISSRALGQGSWQAETCCNFIFQILVHIHRPGLISEVTPVQIDQLQSLYWTKAITSQGNLSVLKLKAASLVQKRVEMQTSPQILAFFCRATKASSLFTNTYLYLRDTQKMGRKLCVFTAPGAGCHQMWV